MSVDSIFDLNAYFRRMYDTAPRELSVQGSTSDELRASQENLKYRLKSVFALELYGSRDTVPPSESVWTEQRDGYAIEKLRLTIAPELTVPLYLLLPKNHKEKLPCVLALNGHGRGACDVLELPDEFGRPHNSDYMKNFPIELCLRGMAVAVPEIIGFGESRFLDRIDENGNGGACDVVSSLSLLWGGNTCGLRLFQAQRVLDWLLTRPFADAKRLGCMGISGGGTVAANLSAVDERVGAAVISGYVCYFRDSIYAMHHCIDNYTPGILRYAELPDIVSLIAPRPLIISCGSRDSIFPEFSVRRAEEFLRPIWKTFGSEDNLFFDYFEGEHEISGAVLFDGMKNMLESL